MPAEDELNQRIGVLTRRETEARILAPLIEALGEEFGRERVLNVLRETIIKIAQEQGAAMAQQMGSDDMQAFADTLPAWQQDDALRIETLRQDDNAFHFNVTRCRYAELYHALGIPELGALLSCNRDFALIEGFNADVQAGAHADHHAGCKSLRLSLFAAAGRKIPRVSRRTSKRWTSPASSSSQSAASSIR